MRGHDQDQPSEMEQKLELLKFITWYRDWAKQAAEFFRRDIENGYHDGREELLAELAEKEG